MPYFASITATPCVIEAIAPLRAAIRRRVRARAADAEGDRMDEGALGPVRHEGAHGSMRADEAAKVKSGTMRAC
jgi:hypothetical protein